MVDLPAFSPKKSGEEIRSAFDGLTKSLLAADSRVFSANKDEGDKLKDSLDQINQDLMALDDLLSSETAEREQDRAIFNWETGTWTQQMTAHVAEELARISKLEPILKENEKKITEYGLGVL